MLNTKTLAFFSSIGGNLLWAFSFLFWPMLNYLDPLLILGHRVIWAVIVLFPFLYFTKQLHKVKAIYTHPRNLCLIFLASFFIGANWFSLVWTVNNNMSVEASLGYFVSPLLNMIFAGIILKEKSSNLKNIALGLFGFSLIYNIIYYGEFPIYAFTIGTTFATYVFIHKKIDVDLIPAFFLEMLILTPFSIALLAYASPYNLALVGYPFEHYFLLFSTVFFTPLPLLLYTYGVKYLTLTNVGIIQYISPSLAFILAVFVIGNPVKSSDYITFPVIWIALIICTYDMISTYRKNLDLTKAK